MNKTYDYQFVRFLQSDVVIKVSNTTDYKLFKKILEHLNIHINYKEDDTRYKKLSYFRNLAIINAQFNGEQPYMSGPLFFEFNNGKGICFDWNEKRVKDYWCEDYQIVRPRVIFDELGLEE